MNMTQFKFSGKVNARESVGGVFSGAYTVVSATGTARSSMPLIFANSGPQGEKTIGKNGGESNVYRDSDATQLPNGTADVHFVNAFTRTEGAEGLATALKGRMEQSITENRGALIHFSDLGPLTDAQLKLQEMGSGRFEPVTSRETLEQRIEWHIVHHQHCQCRDIPEKLKAEIIKRSKQ